MFESAKEYDDYVQDQAKKLEEYFLTHNYPNFNVSIIPFNSITCDDFGSYYETKDVNSMEFENNEKDFLPSGYKTAVEECC
jgi:hypothetical protein